MISLHELESHFQHLPAGQLDILVEIHNLVAQACPRAVEDIRSYGIVYYDAQRGGPVSAGICQALLRGGQVRLAFNHGAFLPDPHGLLTGDRLPKRYIPILNYEDAPWECLAELIGASARFNPRQT